MVTKWPLKLQALNLSSKQEEGKRHPAVLLTYFPSVLFFLGGLFVCLSGRKVSPMKHLLSSFLP